MKFVGGLTMLGLCFHSLTMAAVEADKVSAEKFFERYVSLGADYDPALASLYADAALIKTRRTYPNGEVRVIELPGQTWKGLVIAAMPLAKQAGDKSTFSNVQVSIGGNRARIKADRHSNLKCYADKGYYMIIEKAAKGDYSIVEEYSETQPQSNC